ncbi:hypothetical protein F6X53_24000 [Methylobacterium soli]|uniref:Uncharacterized protein n=1 Tax=Methylobacterium soli TaxID=553447 RepID=A0A6L3STZ4_9HYPH|nr:hypothetical protein F6X53_24000 [Methylobacterium soli]
MPYSLHCLAAGSYDLALNGKVIGSVVRNVEPSGRLGNWRVELLDDLPAIKCPAPFQKTEHRFRTLAAVLAWLGDPPIVRLVDEELKAKRS